MFPVIHMHLTKYKIASQLRTDRCVSVSLCLCLAQLLTGVRTQSKLQFPLVSVLFHISIFVKHFHKVRHKYEFSTQVVSVCAFQANLHLAASSY